MLKKLFSLSAAMLLMASSYAFAQTATGNAVSISMQGFWTVNRKVTIVTGSSSQVSVGLAVGAMSDTVEVTAEAALVDIKKRSTSTTLSTSDLKEEPKPCLSAR